MSLVSTADVHPSRENTRLGPNVSLDDKYLLEEGRIFLTGTQALVRVVLDQMRADRRGGRDTAAMVSGYPGSPLGGFDQELARQRKVCEPLRVVHQPGQNEELGATAVWGSQLVPKPRHDGVVGFWYGKAPGVDRAADSLRHGNFAGAHPSGGLVAFCGDDPSCKSSTLPSATEAVLASLGMPVIVPGTPQEVLDLGLHAVAASRASGLWVAMKVVTNVADAQGSANVSPQRVNPVIPVVEHLGRPYVHVPNGMLLGKHSLELERSLSGPRLELARAYARENNLDRIVVNTADAWLGVVASGTAYYDMREGLRKLGLDDEELRRRGVRILKLGMIWPLEREVVEGFADGLEEIVVVEEKGPFVETALKELLYDLARRPRVLGKRDEDGKPLVPIGGALDADIVARVIGRRLIRRGIEPEVIEDRMRRCARPVAPLPLLGPDRTPFFCSGCPHNRSTDVPDGAAVGAGIGCHVMVVLNPESKGELTGLTQMGGEGSQWIGQAPFSELGHLFQNIGDGTFMHSGSLAVRAAVASGVNITFKLLYNSAVAMTGGQDVQPALPVPDLTRWLEIEGVRRVVVTTDEPNRYRGARLAKIAGVRPRSELIDVQAELAQVPGVTVLIHDQQCAAEKRRLRKRGKLVDPAKRVVINERVCEGCGDCGRKSDCLSVLPVDTEFGRKTAIHQASCNKDYSCLEGDCPSFVTVVPAGKRQRRVTLSPPSDLPEPTVVVSEDEATIRFMGVGGTGVVTLAQIVGMAAVIDGKHVRGLDQTGLAQKGGPVTSDVRIFRDAAGRSNKATTASVDAYIGLDLIGAADADNLATADPARTVAVVSTSQVPTGSMIVDPTQRFGELDATLATIERRTLSARNIYLDAQAVAEAAFGDSMPANTICLGAAWQSGLVPLSREAIERAIRLNGAAVEDTLAAFAWGRAAVAAPEFVEAATRVPRPEPRVSPRAEELIASVGAPARSELDRLLRTRVPDLITYQNVRYARSYVEFVQYVSETERHATPGWTEIAEAVARHLFKLMSYKDEYEVARLHLDPVERARITAEFGRGAKRRYHLHPPLLRTLGLRRKLVLGSWLDGVFRVLYLLRFVRGTRLDLFGYAAVRRVERGLIGQYRADLLSVLPGLCLDTRDDVLALAELPDIVRGYEEIKLRNVAAYRERATELLTLLEPTNG